jgi:DNA-nicking Smr family endonuclease
LNISAIGSWEGLGVGSWEWLVVGPWELGIEMKIPIEDSIDLHPFAPRDVASVVEEYVTAAHEAGLREVRLIHGRGKGVQRGIVQQVLEDHPLVLEFWDAPETHLGATVARLSD